MAYSNEASGGPAEAVERITRSTIASGGLLAMGAAFVVEYQGYARSVAAVMLFSGAVLFSAGMGVALKLRVDDETTPRDAGQFEWYMRACTMPLSALLVTLFVAPDVWAAVSGNGTVDLVYLGVAATLTATLFLELVLFRLRPKLNDELSRAYAAGAMGWGFVAGFAGSAVVLALMMIEPGIGVMAMMPMMVVSVWVAGLRLAWLMGRGG